MNPSIQREITRIERLGERVEIRDNEIIIHNQIVPDYIAEAFVARIKKADAENKYRVIIKSA